MTEDEWDECFDEYIEEEVDEDEKARLLNLQRILDLPMTEHGEIELETYLENIGLFFEPNAVIIMSSIAVRTWQLIRRSMVLLAIGKESPFEKCYISYKMPETLIVKYFMQKINAGKYIEQLRDVVCFAENVEITMSTRKDCLKVVFHLSDFFIKLQKGRKSMISLKQLQETRGTENKVFFIGDHEMKFTGVTDGELYFFMNIILDEETRPKRVKQLFEKIEPINRTYPTASQLYESINQGEEFAFVHAGEVLKMKARDLMNGFNMYMAQYYGKADGSVYEKEGYVRVDLSSMEEEQIMDVLFYSLLGEEYSRYRAEILSCIQDISGGHITVAPFFLHKHRKVIIIVKIENS